MPVLFMRLKSGRLWYTRGFTDDTRGLESWPALVANIRKRRCTPILGPALTEFLLDTRREIARRWAEKYNFPMSPHDREHLPKVAQYLSTLKQGIQPYDMLKDELEDYLRQKLLDYYRDEPRELYEELRKEWDDAELAKLIAAASDFHQDPKLAELIVKLAELIVTTGAPQQEPQLAELIVKLEELVVTTGNLQRDPKFEELIVTGSCPPRESGPTKGHLTDPYAILADLPLPIYITTNFELLMERALEDADKKPEREFCRWNPDIEHLRSIYDDNPDYCPDAKNPLVYHLFGHIEETDSLVLTEDDYFDYLIGATRNKELIPPTLRVRLVNTCLLFLGFQLDDWSFRVLYRILMSQQGSELFKKRSHIAVQIDPEEDSIMDPQRARRYLQDYFRDTNISIYWGSATDFLQELQQYYEKESKP